MKQRNIKKIDQSDHIYQRTSLRKCTGLVNGFDTETDTNGNVLTICDGYRTPISLLNNGRLKDILTYMTSKKYCSGNNFFWNIDFDVSVIMKNLPKINQIELYDKGYTAIPFKNNYLKIEYFKRKCLTLSQYKDKELETKIDHTSFRYWDMMPYYNNISLKKAASFVNREKFEVEEINELNYDKFHSDYEYKNMIYERVQSDCITTMKLSKLMIEVLNDIAPYDKFFSLAGNSCNLALHSLPKDKCNSKGYLKYVTDKMNQIALMSYGGGIFTPLKKGYFPKVYSYDLNSAYTSAIIHLKSFEGEQIFSPESMKTYDDNFNHLFIKCNISIPDGLTYSPFQFRTINSLYYITGEFKNIWVSKVEYDHFLKEGYISKSIGFIGIDDRYNESFYIFRDIQLKLYSHKKEIKARMVKDSYDTDKDKQYDKVLYNVVKTLLNSLYGKTINVNEAKKYLSSEDIEMLDLSNMAFEKNRVSNEVDYYQKLYKSGTMFAAPLGSEITASTRVLIHEAVKGNEDNVINIATDGIKTIKPIKGMDIGTELGQWEDELKGGCLSGVSLASGQYSFSNQEYRDNPKSKNGILKLGSRGISRGFDFIPMLSDNPNVLGFKTIKNSPLKTFKCVKGLEYNTDDIGKFIETEKEFSLLDGDRYTRNWDRNFNSNDDILNNSINSRALSLDELLKIPNIRLDKFRVGLKKMQ